MTLRSIEEYGPAFQMKVISSLLTHKAFLQNIYDILSDEYFVNPAHKWIINEILDYYQKYHTTVSMDVLKVEMKKMDNEVLQISVKEQLREAYKADIDDLEYVREEFSTFCKNQQLKRALLSSVDLLKAGDYDSIKYMIESAMKAGQDKDIGHEYKKDLESRYREDHRKTVPTPWSPINKLIQGGLGNGDLGLIFGNPGGGKSWTLVAIGGHAVKMGYNVLHYTLELSESYTGRRYDAFFSQIPVDNLDKHKKEIEALTPDLPGELIIREFPTGKTTTNALESHIKKVQDLGIKPDLVIIDYIDLLATKKRNVDRKGGSIFVTSGSTIHAELCWFDNNKINDAEGGGINSNGVTVIKNTVMTNNIAGGVSASLFLYVSSRFRFTNKYDIFHLSLKCANTVFRCH